MQFNHLERKEESIRHDSDDEWPNEEYAILVEELNHSCLVQNITYLL